MFSSGFRGISGVFHGVSSMFKEISVAFQGIPRAFQGFTRGVSSVPELSRNFNDVTEDSKSFQGVSGTIQRFSRAFQVPGDYSSIPEMSGVFLRFTRVFQENPGFPVDFKKLQWRSRGFNEFQGFSRDSEASQAISVALQGF